MTEASGGGSATQIGTDFENRVTAWATCFLLGEQRIEAWGLPAGMRPVYLRCQTEQPVDDLLVGYAQAGTLTAVGHVYVQAKHKPGLEQAEDSDLASFLGQCVRQYLANAKPSKPAHTLKAWERPLERGRDWMVMVAGPTTPNTVAIDLRTLLQRIRMLVPGQTCRDMATTDALKRAFDVTEKHVRAAWKAETGADPTDSDLQALLALVDVHVLDVDTGGEAEAAAKQHLASFVLHAPGDSARSWERLVEASKERAIHRGGMDLPSAQHELLREGIRLRIPPSLEGDVAKLVDYSQRNLESLAAFHTLPLPGGASFSIHRACVTALGDMATTSFLVLGEPGAGKSGVIYEFARDQLEAGRDVVVLRADRLPSDEILSLREHLGLGQDLVALLKRWPGLQPGYLVIDALDAARTERAASLLVDLVRDVRMLGATGSARPWHVVASVRKFDLRYNPDLQDAFAGTPCPHFVDRSFPRVRHVHVERLSEGELAQVWQQSPDLERLHGLLDPSARPLLTNPFHLSLAAKLLAGGVSPQELGRTRSALELLDRYWRARVLREPDAHGRERVVRIATEQMVATRRLHVETHRVADAAGPQLAALRQLLHDGVLTEYQPHPAGPPRREVLTFPHHLLYDAAVERLLLRGAPGELANRLAGEPDEVLFLRPSLWMHFGYLWDADPSRQEFWETVFLLAERPDLPEVTKTLGPAVAAELFQARADVAPLLQRLSDPVIERRRAGEVAFRHLVGAALTFEAAHLVGPRAAPWAFLARDAAPHLSDEGMAPLLDLLRTLTEKPEDLSPASLQAANAAAREALRFILAEPYRHRALVHPIRAMCRTFSGDPDASARLVRHILDRERLPTLAAWVLPVLAWEVKRLMPVAPALVAEIYQATFAYQEQSTDQTPLGGPVMLLVSTKKQSVESARYSLTKAYAEFLQTAPETALQSLLEVLHAFVEWKHPEPVEGTDRLPRPFDLRGAPTGLIPDWSSIWDARRGLNEMEPVGMLEDVERYLEALARDPSRLAEMQRALDLLAASPRHAVWWRRLLSLGARYPRTLGLELREFAWSAPLLRSIDTKHPMGAFLTAVFPVLPEADRARAERALLDLVSPDSADERLQTYRAMYLGGLPKASLVTEEARRFRESLGPSGPPNTPPFSSRTTSRPYTHEDWLAEQGVPLQRPEVQAFRAITEPVRRLIQEASAAPLPPTSFPSSLDAVRRLHEALTRPEAGSLPPPLLQSGWHDLAEACEVLAGSPTPDGASDDIDVLREFLLEVSLRPDPSHSPSDQEDTSASYVRTGSRFFAAGGLVRLAGLHRVTLTEVLDALDRLSRDKVSSVRLKVAEGLPELTQAAPEFAKALLRHFAETETHPLVVDTLILHLENAPSGDRTQVLDALRHLMGGANAVTDPKRRDDLLASCAPLALKFWVEDGDEAALALLEPLVTAPADVPSAAHAMAISLRPLLTHGPIEPPETRFGPMRRRAFAFLERLARTAADAYVASAGRLQTTDAEGRPGLEDAAKASARTLDTVGYEIYFGSGAYDATSKKKGSTAESEPNEVPLDVRRRFLEEAQSLLRTLATVGFPSVIHHLIETLAFLVEVDPASVFLLVAQAVEGGAQGGYETDPMAAQEIVRLVERYLAQYRHVFRDDSACRRALLSVLDRFVRARWPEAQRLTYRLEEVFR